MDRSRIRPWLPVLVVVLALAGAATPARSQQNANPSVTQSPAQRVDAMSVEDAGSRSVLTIQGRFEPALIPDVMLQPLGGDNAFNIEIPGAAPATGLAAARTFPSHPLLKGYRVTTLPPGAAAPAGAVNIVLELQPGARASLDVSGSDAAKLRVILEGTVSTAPDEPAMGHEEEMMAEAPASADGAITAETGAQAMEAEPVMMDEPKRSMAAPWQARPILLRVAVLNASGGADSAVQAAALVLEMRRLRLEHKLGMRLEIANLSRAPGAAQKRSVIYYREGFLRAALALAELLPGEQALEPMPPERASRKGIDVEIWLGKDVS